MENEPLSHGADDGRSRKGRLMGKLFGRDRKASIEERGGDRGGDLNDFFHGPSDIFPVSHPAPPTLAKLDTRAAARYPNALTVNNASAQNIPLRPRSHSPRMKSRKGLAVRFVDTRPEIIGEGGDEAEAPVTEIGFRKRTRSAPGPGLQRPSDLVDQARAYSELNQPDSSFVPGPLRRTQTGYSTIGSVPEREVQPGIPTAAPFLDAPVVNHEDRRKSFVELRHEIDKREAEGVEFAKGARLVPDHQDHGRDDYSKSPSIPSVPDSPIGNTQLPPPPPPSESPEARLRRGTVEQSPSSVYSTTSSLNQPYPPYRQNSRLSDRDNGSPASPMKASMNLHDVVIAAGDDALSTFVARTRHLFELFRLHSETVRPLLSCAPEDLARAALWWFLSGRMALENAVREQPSNPQAQRQNEMAKQQAFADLAKGYWLCEDILPDVLSAGHAPTSREVEEARRALLSSLRKLAMSMQRNGFLPPEEALLPQAIDRSIWLEYAPISQDIRSLLWGIWDTSALSSSHRSAPTMSILESLPVGDSAQDFNFGRVRAELCLMEQGMDSQRLYFPCLLSMLRPQTQPNLMFVIASQDGSVQLRIQSSKGAGPTWADLRWTKNSTIEVKLPRGFLLVIQFAPQDFQLLRSMYDFGNNVQSYLFPRQDEQPVFRTTLKAFQYFDGDPQSRQFPKEPVPDCEIALFERLLRENAATGPRSYHLGYRVAVVTGTRTRTLAGVSHAYRPQMPVQFSFLRGGEQDDPALLLNYDTGRTKGSMVLTFGSEKERLHLHSLLVGTALQSDEHIFLEVPLLSMSISQGLKDMDGLAMFKKLPFQRLRIINYEDGNDFPQTVLADKLRLVVEFNNGIITDRVNVGPGELKVRLDVGDMTSISIMRQPQQDFTAAVSEKQVPRELPRELGEGLLVLREASTCRRYHFANVKDLHDFQFALTGFQVLFDGIAATFAISRRRMVVPIHKKWEAGATRIQIVRQEKVTQLLAFFQDFHHGESMSLVLKGTDVFEAISRSGKAGLKIDDAKFPLPRMSDGPDGVGDDAAFVCLDMPELPGEHDDITILFEDEGGMWQFLSRKAA
jgi:hypothetical protein